MNSWCFMFLFSLLIPVLMLIGGRLMWKHCPKQINNVIGYRTNRSMKNMDTWAFAHNFCGRLWWNIGLVLFLISIIVSLCLLNSSEEIIKNTGGITILIQVFLLVGSIIPTEVALKKTFNKEGIRK